MLIFEESLVVTVNKSVLYTSTFNLFFNLCFVLPNFTFMPREFQYNLHILLKKLGTNSGAIKAN